MLFLTGLDREVSVILQALLELMLNSLIDSRLWLKMSDLHRAPADTHCYDSIH
jgi:hypothetical protein